jgi:hypothetical protein
MWANKAGVYKHKGYYSHMSYRESGGHWTIGLDDGKVVACSSVNFHNKPAYKQALLFKLASVWHEWADMQNARFVRHSHNTLSLGWAVQNSWSSGEKSRGKAILSFVTRAWLRKAVTQWVGRAQWYDHSALVLLPVIEIHGSRWNLLGFLLQGLGQGESGGDMHLDDEQSYMHPVNRWGAEGWWCWSIFHLCRTHMHVTSGRVWNLGSVTFVSQSSSWGSWLGVSYCSLSCVVSCTGGGMTRSTCLFHSSQLHAPLISFCGSVGWNIN